MKKRKFLVSLLCLSALLGVAAPALTSCNTKKEPETPVVEYWKVTIDLNDGSTPTTKDVVKGEKLTGVEEPTREGYDFAGWQANGTPWTMDTVITADITIVAQWTPKTLTPVKEYWKVTIDLNDGSTPTTKDVVKGEKLTGVEEPTREGYDFAGWQANGTPWTMDTAITADITIVAQWTPKTLTPVKEYWKVTIDLNDGSTPTTKDVVKGEKLTGVEEPTREGYNFTGWQANGTPWTMDTAITADITIVAQWSIQTPYEAFVSKGNIIYASDFTNVEEIILNSNSIQDYEEAYGKWVGTINDSDDFDDKNDVFIQNGYLNVVDDSSKTTYAQLMLNPVYASVIEVKAVVQPSTLAGSWSIFTLMSPYSSSEYLLNLRTNSNKQICCQTRVYNAAKGIYEDSTLPTTGGFEYVENKDLMIEALVDLSTGEITITLSQDGVTSKTFRATIDAQGYMEQGLPLAFSGVKVMTAGTASRSIKIDWLGARIVSENIDVLKELILAQLEAMYEEYDKSKYTQQLELLEKTYADSVAAIQACNTNAEVLEALNGIFEAFEKVKSDDQLAALAKVEEALQTLAALKEEYKDFYTITKDSEEDYYSNKEAFEELFANAIRNLENPNSVEDIQREIAYVQELLANDWIQNDETILEGFRQYLVNEARAYRDNNGYTLNQAQVDEEIIEPLEAELTNIETKAEMRALYSEYIELFALIDNDEQVLSKAKQEACTELEEYAELALEDLDETVDTDAELIVLINNVKNDAILAINNATELYGNNGVYSIKSSAMDEIGNLNSLAGVDLSEVILASQIEFSDYVDSAKNQYQPEEEEVLAALDQLYAEHENDFDELTTVTAVRNCLKELKAAVDAIVAADALEKDKVHAIQNFYDMVESYKNDIMSESIKADFDALAIQWEEIFTHAESAEELNNLIDQSYNALNDAYNQMFERSFKVTFTNAVGAIYVKYGQNLVAENIHITGMVVTGIFYNGEEITQDNPLVVYDNLEVTLVMETTRDVLDSTFWSASNNTGEKYGVFAETEFFTLSEDTEFAWLNASFSAGYSIGWQSGNFGGNGPDVPILLQIKENLSSLKFHIGLADSQWKSNRTGSISFYKDGVEIKTLQNNNSKLFTEVTLENLVCGDIIEIRAHDLNTGSRIYIFDAEAHLDYNAVPKTVAIIWGDATEPTLYSHLDVVTAPENDPIGEGAFKYWYYLDENGEEVVFDNTIENYFESTTEPIHMLPRFAEANVFITYINGDDEEVVPYSLGDDEMGIEKKVLVGSPTEKFIGWFEEGATEEFDYASVEAGTEVTLYAKWHDLGTKILEESKVYDYTTIPALPETDTMIEYTFDGETLENGVGIKTSNESKGSRNIKINLPFAGKIIVVFDNTTTNARVGFIDTTANKANTTSAYGYVSIGKSNGSDHHVTLTSSDLEAGTYYVNWNGKGIIIESITVVYGVESEVEYTGISGTPVTTYTSGSELSLDLTGLTLNTVEGDAIALETVRADLTIDIENGTEFSTGLAGTYTVSITYGNHTKLVYTVTVE